MDTKALYQLWLDRATDDPDLQQELRSLNPETDEKEIFERFYRNLEFGTGGLRGVIGAGTNRMNVYVIRRAPQGLCNYLKSTSCHSPSPSATTAASRATCSPLKPPRSSPPTASPHGCIPVWSLLLL